MTINYQFDELGRNTEVLRPAHDALIDGVNVAGVRTAQWTVYRDDIDQVWRGQGYIVGEETTLVNPVSISISNAGGQGTKSVSAISSVTDARLSADMEFPESSWVRLSETFYNDGGEMIATRVYHAFGPSWSSLTLDEWDELTLDQWDTMELNTSDNYAETTFGYDAMGRRNRVVSPGGTITRTVFDVRGLTVSNWVGTDDTGATASNPAGSGSPNNMVKVSENQYDGGADGDDGNLSQIKLLVDSSSGNDRTTTFFYDWRNRQITIDGEVDFYQKNYYDNLNRVDKVERYHTTSGGKLIARSETKIDNRGRVYQTIRYAVDPTDGSVGNALTDNTWYDAAGNVLKIQPAGSSAFTKLVIDAIGRTTDTYVGFYGGGGTDSPASLTDNYIFEQSQNTYDAASNLLQTTSLQRFHSDTTSTGALIAPTTSGYNARPTYTALYHDCIGRQIAIANFGTNDNSAFSRPSTVPTRSDDVLVTTTDFDSEGMPYQTTDRAGTVTQQVFDRAGRRVALIENVQGTTGDDKNRTTGWSYTPDGEIETLTALNSTTGDQTTAYAFGVTTTGSTLCSNDLLHTETYPDGGVVTHEYNRQGERIKYSTTAADLEHLQYGYDRASNRLWRKNLVSAGLSTPVYMDELYAYDGLYQLQDMKRGQLTGSPPSGITGLKFEQQWGLDPTGNWANFREDATGGGSWSLNQTRTANQVNEITNIGATTGANWADPVYDPAGNMTTIPQPNAPTSSYTAIYDAWNRLVKLMDGATIVAQFAYVGQTWRTTSGSGSGTRHFYHSDDWQILEERLGASPSTGSANQQYVWGLRYIDELVLRDRSTTGTLNERVYAMQDVRWNVGCIGDSVGAVIGRFIYSSYGYPAALTNSFEPSSWPLSWTCLFSGLPFGEERLYLAKHRFLHPGLGVWITQDQISFGDNLYTALLGNPITRLDPTGLAPLLSDDEVWCESTLRKIALAWKISHPCAGELLYQFLFPKIVNSCPDKCKTALQQGGIGYSYVEKALESQLEAGSACGRSVLVPVAAEGVHRFAGAVRGKGAIGVEQELHWAFGTMTWTAHGSCRVKCGPPNACASLCCCTCVPQCGLFVNVLDTYDFCSTASKVARSPTWCACLLEKSNPKRVFKVNCKDTLIARPLPSLQNTGLTCGTFGPATQGPPRSSQSSPG